MLLSSSCRPVTALATAPTVTTKSGSSRRRAIIQRLAVFFLFAVTAVLHAQTPQAATPTFSVTPGSYSGTQTVAILDTTPGATIYYTTNGTYPGTYSAVYSTPVTVSQSEILVAFAYATGYNRSPYVSGEYLISSSTGRFLYTIAGSGEWGYAGDGGPAASARLNAPYGAVADTQGNVYIADSGNNVVRKADAVTANISTIAGTGAFTDTGDGGPAISATLESPEFLALDGLGNLYIAETGDSVVRKINLATGVITRAAGDPTGTASTGPATTVPLSGIAGIACDSAGNLFIGEELEIARVDTAGNLTVVASPGTPNFPFLSGGGFAMDANHNFYLSANGYGKIYKLDNTGTVTLFAGTGLAPGGDGGPALNAGFGYQIGLATDTAGNLYVADAWNYAIRRIDATTGIVNTVAGVFLNPSTVGGDGDPATSSGLFYPGYISVDAKGNIYLPDTLSRVRVFTAPAAPPAVSAAAPVFNPAAATLPLPQSLTLSSPTLGSSMYVSFDGSSPGTSGLAYHGAINLSGSASINAVAVAPGYLKSPVATGAFNITQPSTAVISTVAGMGYFGFNGNGGPATSALLGGPNAIAFRPDGGYYITEPSNNVVRLVAPGSGVISVVAGTGTAGYSGDTGPATSAELSSPRGVAVDSSGNLYIADSVNRRVRKVDAVTGIITTFAGNGTPSAANGDGGPASSASIDTPVALAFDSLGNLYIADPGAPRVRVVSLATGIINTFAGGGPSNLPPGYGNGGPATSATVDPFGLALDANNNLYIADEFAGVRVVNAGTHIITGIAGGGSAPIADGVPAATVSTTAIGVAVDAKQNVYFADSSSATVRKILPNGTLATVAGNTYFGYSGDGGAASIATLYFPQQIAFDANSNLYIPDSTDDVVRKVIFPSAATAPYFSLAGGTYHSPQTLALTDPLPGAAIYYTFTPAGTVPTTGATLYTGPITINTSGTVEAIAVVPGYSQSAISSKAYTYVPWPPAAAPYFSLAGGTYNTPQSLTLADSTSGATIYYTTNGSTPTTSSNVYTNPITINATETVKAVAIAPNYLLSPVSSKAYTYVAAPLAASPYFSLPGGHYTTPQMLTLTDTTPGAVIYYTTNGTQPSTSSTKYTGPITISTSELVMAIAVAPGYTNSNPSSKAYTVP